MESTKSEVITRVTTPPAKPEEAKPISIQPTWDEYFSIILMALEPQAPRAIVDHVRGELARVARFMDSLKNK